MAVEKIFLADVKTGPAQEFVTSLNTDKIEVVQLNADSDNELRDVISKGEVVINALFYTFNERVVRAAIDMGVHSVDLGGHIGGITEAILQLNEEATRKGVTVVPDLGVAPGKKNLSSNNPLGV